MEFRDSGLMDLVSFGFGALLLLGPPQVHFAVL